MKENQSKKSKNSTKIAEKTEKNQQKVDFLDENAESEETKREKKRNFWRSVFRSSIVIAVLAGLVVLGYFILVWTGAWEYVNSVEKIRTLILSLGFWGRLAFVFIQFLQVTFLPIPSTVSTLAGVLIYGPLQASLLSLAGIMLGSILAFWLGRFFGKKLVVFMVGEKTCEKWTKFLTDAKYSFFVMMVLPMFPDDVLCLVAGLTDMSWTFFVVTNLIARPIGILLTCYLGSGSLIPYHGWGLVVWAILIVVVIVLIYLSYRYRDKIESFLKKTFSTERFGKKKMKKEKKDESLEEKTEQKLEENAKENDGATEEKEFVSDAQKVLSAEEENEQKSSKKHEKIAKKPQKK